MSDEQASPAGPHAGSAITPDARSLRGLAHPLRVHLLGLLRAEGPSTATRLAQRLGLASGATSYHLRQLATHGFIVEEAERGAGRERWWRATHRSTNLPVGDDPETAEAADGFLRGLVAFWAEQMNRALDERPALSRQWREASSFSDQLLRLTPEELHRLRGELRGVLARYRLDDASTAGSAPAGSESVVLQLQVFPRPGVLPEQDER
jgi:DNA-binding transcriptional ArsR family regulator